MFSIKRILTGLTLICALTMTRYSMAIPVSFEITDGSWTNIGSGYGGGSESTLDARFFGSLTGRNFALTNPGDIRRLDIGQLIFIEDDINVNETDNLDVSYVFKFTNPLIGSQTLSTTGLAIIGPTSDGAIDFSLVWAPLFVDFGNEGRFKIELSSSFFSISTGLSLSQVATFTLLDLPKSSPVTEPPVIVLFSLGLIGLVYIRRKIWGQAQDLARVT